MNIWRRAVCISDSSRACYYSKQRGGIVYEETCGDGGQHLVPEADFVDHWVDEGACGRNPRATRTLAALPGVYTQWLQDKGRASPKATGGGGRR